MSLILYWITLGTYLLSATLFLVFIIKQYRILYSLGFIILWAGAALHTLAIALNWSQNGTIIASSLRQTLDLFAWGLMLATILMNFRLKIKILSALTTPLCTLLMLAVITMLPASNNPPSKLLTSIWVVVHVTSLLLGYSLLALTFLSGALYLLQNRLIRAKKLGVIFKRLPSLTRLDQLNHKGLLIGFTLLTIGLIIGAIYAQITLGSYWRWDHKEIWALITWLFYAVLLYTRLAGNWGGRRAAWIAVAAFSVLIFTFVGAGLLLPGYHNFQNLPTLTGPLP